MVSLKLGIFSFIDEVIEYKKTLRFEIEEAMKALDELFNAGFQNDERFINYTSRIKTDESLKEKIIRQNYAERFDSPEKMFDSMSDIIGCRLQCRFISDEHKLYEMLFRLFPKQNFDGYHRSDRNPRIELKLGEPQPVPQKNGFHSYRIDGRYLGTRVLNFELQIKSIVNVFWNEIDHRILYKNYNYVVTEDFARGIMSSIKGELTLIDRQMEMVFNHLRSLESPGLASTNQQIKTMIGRLLQDVYIVPIRDNEGIVLDFRKSTDLITDFIFARVQYETRETYANEFVRVLEEINSSNYKALGFGEKLHFDPPIRYHNNITSRLGSRLEAEVNSGLIWNLIIRILFELIPDIEPQMLFRTFVDYLYFVSISAIRDGFAARGLNFNTYDRQIDRIAEQVISANIANLEPDAFTPDALRRLTERVERLLDRWAASGYTDGAFTEMGGLDADTEALPASGADVTASAQRGEQNA